MESLPSVPGLPAVLDLGGGGVGDAGGITTHEAGRASVARHVLDLLGAWGTTPEHPIYTWIANQTRRTTQAKYAATVREFGVWLSRDRGVADPLLATFEDLVAYRDYLAAPPPSGLGLKRGTQATKLNILSGLYTHLTDRRVLLAHPMKGLKLPRADEGTARRAWTPEEIYAFFHAIPRDGSLLSLRDRAVFWLAFRNGLRVSELVGANVGDLVVKQGQRVLEVQDHGGTDQHVKGGYSRDVWLKPETCSELDAYLAARGLEPGAVISGGVGAWRDWPLFARVRPGQTPGRRPRSSSSSTRVTGQSREDGRLTRQQVWSRIRVYGTRAGLDPSILYPHAGRHTFASTLASQGVPIFKMKQATGHHSTRALERYVHEADLLGNNAARLIPY